MMKNFQRIIWSFILVCVIAVLFCGCMHAEVKQLNEKQIILQEEKDDITRVELWWGPVITSITEQEQIDEIISAVQNMKLTSFRKTQDDANTIRQLDSNRIIFVKGDKYSEASVFMTGDFQRTFYEAELQIQNADELRTLFVKYGQPTIEEYKSSTLYADLDHDGTDELLLTNPERNDFGIYRADGVVLWHDYMDNPVSLRNEYYLYQKDGEAYLFYFAPHEGKNYVSYAWWLIYFDASGRAIVAEEDYLAFDTDSFEVDEVLAYLSRVDGFLQDATLLTSRIENGVLYSTSENEIHLDINYYLRWQDGIADEASLQRRLQMAHDVLSISDKIEDIRGAEE